MSARKKEAKKELSEEMDACMQARAACARRTRAASAALLAPGGR